MILRGTFLSLLVALVNKTVMHDMKLRDKTTMAQIAIVVLLLIQWPSDAFAGLFGPSAGEEAAMIVGVIFGIPALVMMVALYLRAKVKLAEKRTATSLTSQNLRFDIFLSYSAKDIDQARQLSELIQQSDLKVFFAQKDIEGGSPFTDEIRAALHESREVWVLATHNSINSVWVATEWGTAWALQRRIVPVLVDITSDQLPDRLRAHHAVQWSHIAEEIQKVKKRARSDGGFGKRTYHRWIKVAAVLIVIYLVLWILAQ